MPTTTNLPQTHGYLILSSIGNPTYKVRVSDAEEASKLWCAYRDRLGIGASALKSNSGNLVDSTGKIVARVSYNGRIWDPTMKTLLWGEDLGLSLGQVSNA